MGSPKHLAAKRSAVISNRDQETLLRLTKRLGVNELIDHVRALENQTSKPRARGPRQLPQIPHSVMAALHYCWQQHKEGRCGTISDFQRELGRVAEIKYSRTDPGLDQLPDLTRIHKNRKAFGAYLNRADWKQPTNRPNSDLRNLLRFLMVWRFGALEHGTTWKTQGIWGMHKGGPYFRIEPKNPRELIKWIDAAIAADRDLQTEAQYWAESCARTASGGQALSRSVV